MPEGKKGKKKAVKAELIPVQPSELGQYRPMESIEDILLGYLSEKTRESYWRDIKAFFEYMGYPDITPDAIRSITPSDANRYRLYLEEERGMKPSTIARKLSAIRSVFSRYVIMGNLPFNPFDIALVKSPKRPTVRQTDMLAWEEAISLLKAPDRSTVAGRRDYAMIMVGLNCGLRVEEICGLRKDDIRTSPELHFKIRGKGQKERLVGIRDDVKKAIDETLQDVPSSCEWLFAARHGGRMTTGQFWRRLKVHAKAVDIKTPIHPHTLRATFITMALDKGVSIDKVQMTAGHSSGSTTLGYARDLEAVKQSATKALEGLSGD